MQIDGCDRLVYAGCPCTALVYVDDATSKLMELLFVNPSHVFLPEATRRYR
jgi:hypothetical protein